MGIGDTYESQPGLALRPGWHYVCKRGSPDVITSRVVRAPRQGLSSSRRANGGPLGARDASQACVGVDAGRPCSVQTIETVCGLRTQGSTGVELGTLTHAPGKPKPRTATSSD